MVIVIYKGRSRQKMTKKNTREKKNFECVYYVKNHNLECNCKKKEKNLGLPFPFRMHIVILIVSTSRV